MAGGSLQRLVLAAALSAVCLAWSVEGLSWDEAGLGAWSDDYYSLVEDAMGGVDHYQALGVSEGATKKEVKSAWRDMTRTRHPDKIKGAEEKEAASLEFIKIIRANEVLSDEQARRVYDHFRQHGVPWEKRFYGRYAHRYGVPEVALWKVVSSFVAVATGVHYMVLKTRYERYTRLAKQTPIYQKKLRLLQQQALDERRQRGDVDVAKGSAKKKKKQRKGQKADAEELLAGVVPEIEIKGLEAPGLWNLLPVKIARSIWRLVWFVVRDWICDRILGFPIDREAIFRKENGLECDEDWEEYKAEKIAANERFLKSNKAKKYRRLMRKYQ